MTSARSRRSLGVMIQFARC